MQTLYKEESNSRAQSRVGGLKETSRSSKASIGLNESQSDSNYSFLSAVPKRHPSRNRFFTPKIVKDLPPPV